MSFKFDEVGTSHHITSEVSIETVKGPINYMNRQICTTKTTQYESKVVALMPKLAKGKHLLVLFLVVIGIFFTMMFID